MVLKALLFVLLTANLNANPQDYAEGKRFAKTLNIPKPNDQSQIPEGIGFVTDDPQEAHYRPKDLAKLGIEAMASTEVGQAFTETYNERGRFEIEEELFTQADEIVNNPEAELNVEGGGDSEAVVKSKIRTCQEGGEAALYTCQSNLNVQVAVIPAVREQGYTCGGCYYPWLDTKNCYNGWAGHGWGPNHPGCINRVPYSNVIRPKQVKEAETEQSTCEALNERAEKNLCSYVEKKCTQGAGTRTINGEPVYRDCWQYTYTYLCESDVENTCNALRKKGCSQIDSACSEFHEGVCIAWEQTFECAKRIRMKNGSFSENAPFCLDGNCAKQSWAANGDMAEALSKLAIFNEMQKDMNADNAQVFPGDIRACKKKPVSFKSCCNGPKGWGVKLGFGDCDEKEVDLWERRDTKKQCVYVGTYCSQKTLLGVCVTKESSYCCFKSKLARIIHEQGRAQLGIGWGDAENPQCRALTVDELTRINFEHIDLSELFAEIQGKVQVNTQKALNQLQNNLESAVDTATPRIEDEIEEKKKKANNNRIRMERKNDL